MEVKFMFETLDRMMMAGVGALSMTRERAEKIFDEYVKRGQAERETRSGFVKEVMDSADRTRSELQNLVADQVRQVMKGLQVATQEDVGRIEREVATKADILRIEQKLDQLLARGQ
jgi:polyhydroxyalkanoate synthesis regulator phasin